MQQNEECQTSILRESILYTQSQTDDLYQQLQEAVSTEKSYRKAEQKPSAKWTRKKYVSSTELTDLNTFT